MLSLTGDHTHSRALFAHSSLDNFSHLSLSNGNTAVSLRPLQTESLLLALPVEILVYLIQKMDDFVTPITLSCTCWQFREIYQDKTLYQAHERQSHLLMYNLTTPLLRSKLYAALLNKAICKIAPPDLHTPQWHQLRDYPVAKGLIAQPYQTALIQKTYITAWDLLLQPTVLDNVPLASELMRILVELLPYVKGAKVYAQKLFSTAFPKDIFIKLVNMDVESGVQLVCRHFSASDAQAFIATVDTSLHTVVIQGWDHLKEYSSMISVLTGKPYPSFLHSALESFYLKTNYGGCKLTHPGLKDLLKAFLLEATDCPITYEELPQILQEKYNQFELSKILDQQPHFNPHTPIKVTDNHTPLMLACRYNRPELIQLLLQQPAVNMNVRNIKRESALDYAVKYSTPDVVQALLAHGVEKDTHLFAFYYALKLGKNEMISALLPKVNQEEFINQTLRHTITERNPYVVYTLIKDYAADYNTQDDDGYSALFIALSHYNNVEVSRRLLNTLLQYPDLKIQGEKKKNEALAYALRLEKYPDTELIELVTRLIKLGADYNAQDEYGYTPLMLACIHKREAPLKLLLQQPSIDIKAKQKDNLSVLELAVEYGTLTMIEALLKHGVDVDAYLGAFNYALKKKKYNMIRFLQQHAKEADFTNQALACAITAGEIEIVHSLIKNYGAHPNTVDAGGLSALSLALQKKELALLDTLLTYPELKLNIEKEPGGKAALHYALELKKYISPHKKIAKLVTFLLAQGADCNMPNSEGNTPLMLACLYRWEEVVELLLQQKTIEVNAKNNLGYSALAYAVKGGAAAIVQNLLAHDIAPDIHLSAFNYAIHLNKEEIAKILWQKAKIRGEGAFIQQAVTRALEKGQDAVAAVLRDKYGA